MSDRYRLLGLNNSELLAGLSDLVRRSNELTGDVLAHLAELEERMLHLELGFASAFAYCVQVLGLSEGAAGRRLTGARVCRRFPEAFALVTRGDLHLSALCELGPHLNPENSSELFEACRRKTRRQVEELLAARFPKPDVREQIRRLPVRTEAPRAVREAQPSECAESRTEVSAQPVSTDHRKHAGSMETAGIPGGAECKAAGPCRPSRVGGVASQRREIEALSVDRFGVRFTADVELRELMERARALASHRLPKGDLSSLMKLALTSFVEQEEKRRFALGRKPRKVAANSKRGNARTQMQATGSREAPVEASSPPASALSASALSASDTLSTPPGGASPDHEQPGETASLSRTGKRGRHVPAAVRREVYERDQGRCSFVAADGRRCRRKLFSSSTTGYPGQRWAPAR